jgi:transposase
MFAPGGDVRHVVGASVSVRSVVGHARVLALLDETRPLPTVRDSREIQWKFGQTYLTLVYQIDVHVRRLIWVGEERTKATLNRCFDWLGSDRIAELRFICSDMWKAYLTVIRKRPVTVSISSTASISWLT